MIGTRKQIDIPKPLTEELFHLLGRAADQVLKATDRFLSPFQIRNDHFSVLMVLADGGEWNQERLAKCIGVQRNRMVWLIDHLELNDWVTREQNEDDRREYKLLLTPEGRQKFEQLRTLMVKAKLPYMRELTETELSYINSLLRRLLATNLGHAPSWREIDSTKNQTLSQAEQDTTDTTVDGVVQAQ